MTYGFPRHYSNRDAGAGRNKLRSILTMLGIIIGVGAVIAMVSVGQGAQQQAQQQIAAMGSNMLFVPPAR